MLSITIIKDVKVIKVVKVVKDRLAFLGKDQLALFGKGQLALFGNPHTRTAFSRSEPHSGASTA